MEVHEKLVRKHNMMRGTSGLVVHLGLQGRHSFGAENQVYQSLRPLEHSRK